MEDAVEQEFFEAAFNLVAFGNIDDELTPPRDVDEADKPAPTADDLEIERQLEATWAGA